MNTNTQTQTVANTESKLPVLPLGATAAQLKEYSSQVQAYLDALQNELAQKDMQIQELTGQAPGVVQALQGEFASIATAVDRLERGVATVASRLDQRVYLDGFLGEGRARTLASKLEAAKTGVEAKKAAYSAIDDAIGDLGLPKDRKVYHPTRLQAMLSAVGVAAVAGGTSFWLGRKKGRKDQLVVETMEPAAEI
jgi:chromosome segregation ATPase